MRKAKTMPMYFLEGPETFRANRREHGENFIVSLEHRDAKVLVSGDPADVPEVLTVVGWGKVFVSSPCTVKAYGNEKNGGLVVFAWGEGVRVEASDRTRVFALDGAQVLVKSSLSEAYGLNARLSVLEDGKEAHGE